MALHRKGKAKYRNAMATPGTALQRKGKVTQSKAKQRQSKTMQRELVTSEEAAELLLVSEGTLRRMRNRGDIAFVRFGGRGRVRYRLATVLRYIEACEQRADVGEPAAACPGRTLRTLLAIVDDVVGRQESGVSGQGSGQEKRRIETADKRR